MKVTDPPGAMVTAAGLQRNAVLLTPTEAEAGFPVDGFVVGVAGTACVGAGVLPAGGFVAAGSVAVGLGAAVGEAGAAAVAVVVGDSEMGAVGEPFVVVGAVASVATDTAVGALFDVEPPPHPAVTNTNTVTTEITIPRIFAPLKWFLEQTLRSW